jgi:D-sedoheptulose 7-phosphate isomerase
MSSLEKIFQESIRVKEETLKANKSNILEAVHVIAESLKKGGKVLFFGNGGSAADSQHIAAELIGRFQKERRALAAIALTTDTSILTALSNDYTFDIVFARQIEGLGQKHDVAFGISTSGNSANVIEGIKMAKKIGLKTISLTGRDGGKLAKLTDVSLVVPSENTARIQESHLCIAHSICELVEEQLT